MSNATKPVPKHQDPTLPPEIPGLNTVAAARYCGLGLAERLGCRHPTADEDANLGRLGITAAAMVCTPCGGVLIGMIETSGAHFQFAPDGTGRKALILATDIMETEDGAEILDLLAFDPRQPGRWWLRLGLANWLAGYQVDRRSITSGLGPLVAPPTMPGGYTAEALPLHRSPLSWLRAGCVGAVPLVPEALDNLRFIDAPVLCEDLAHAEEVERLLQRPRQRMPLLTVPMPEEVAA